MCRCSNANARNIYFRWLQCHQYGSCLSRSYCLLQHLYWRHEENTESNVQNWAKKHPVRRWRYNVGCDRETIVRMKSTKQHKIMFPKNYHRRRHALSSSSLSLFIIIIIIFIHQNRHKWTAFVLWFDHRSRWATRRATVTHWNRRSVVHKLKYNYMLWFMVQHTRKQYECTHKM